MQGSCLCGAVAFTVRLGGHAVTCHCTQCRQQSGHVFAASPTPLSALHLTNEQGLAWVRASPIAKRGFCRQCGSFLFWKHDDEDRVFVSCGALDGPTGLTLGAALFAAEAGDYYSVDGPPPEPAQTPEILHGACLCGANRFALPGPMGEVTACHCRQCRKTSGHYSASFDAREADLTWQARQVTEYATPGGAQRGFCPSCGSSLTFRAGDGSFSIEAGCIRAPTGGRLTAHIFTAEAGDYYTLTDGLPAHPGWDQSGGAGHAR